MYITRAKSNLKQGISLDFSQKNVVLIGPNGAGKTGILNSITLATLGEVQDAGYRDTIKDPKMIAPMVPLSPNGKPQVMWAQAELSNDEYFRWESGGGKARREMPKVEVHDMFPMVQEVLRGSRETVLNFLHTHFIETADEATWSQLIDDQAPGAAIAKMAKEALAVHKYNAPKAWTAVRELAKQAGETRKVAERALAPFESSGAENNSAQLAVALQQILKQQIKKPDGKCYLCSTINPVGIYQVKLTNLESKMASMDIGESALVGSRKQIWAQQKVEATEQEEAFKTVASVILEGMSVLVQRNLDWLTAEFCQLQTDMLPGWVLGLEVNQKVCRIGFLNGNQVIPAVSGGEWVFVVASVAAALAKRLSGLKLLVLPDKSYDANTLDAFKILLPRIDANVFVQIASMNNPEPWGDEWDTLVLNKIVVPIESEMDLD
jgi:energy-coupling factor transporter ATP-binding protein EcfA2